MKYLGMDYGQAKVGLAVGDDETKLALGKGQLEGFTQNKLIEKIKAIVNIESIERIIVGLPLNMKGETTQITDEVNLFVNKLRSHLTIPVSTFDERFTSAMADNLLADVKDKKHKQDQVAAQLILQSYLDSLVKK